MTHIERSIKEKILGRIALLSRLLKRAAPVSPDPFSTHLAALLAAGRECTIRRVLELGSGLHSTPAFLDRNCFPYVESVVSIENDTEWAQKVRAACGGEARLDIRITRSVANYVTREGIEGFDMVFVDDSSSVSERLDTIKAVCGKKTRGAVVVIHDFENPIYRAAAYMEKNIVVFDHVQPHTAVICQNSALAKRLFAWARQTKGDLGTVSLSDRVGWAAWFSNKNA